MVVAAQHISGLAHGKNAMEPLKNLIERAWESLTDGWRELLTRGSGALTHFGSEGPPQRGIAAGISALEPACGGDLGDRPVGRDSHGDSRYE